MCKKTTKAASNNINIFIIALQFTLWLLLINPLLNNLDVTSFSDRTIGNGLLNGIDITKRVNSIYILLIFIIPIFTYIINNTLKELFKGINSKNIEFLEFIAALGIINIFLTFISFLQGEVVTYTTVFLLLGINLTIVLLILLSKTLKKELDFKLIKWSFLSATPIAFLVALIMHICNIEIYNKDVNWIVSYFIGFILLFLFSNIKSINKDALKKAYIPFLIAPLLEMIYLELYNILNQYNIFLQNKIETIITIYIVCFAITIIMYLIYQKKHIIFNYTKYYYPIILVICGMVIAAVPMVTIVNTDFFESANHGLGVYEFLKYGKIPIIENFDAHMLNNEFFGIIYGILNHDTLGAIFCIYTSYKKMFFCIITYIFLKQIFSKDTAFCISMFFPLEMDAGLKIYYMAFVAIIALLNAYKKKTMSSYFILELSILFLCVARLDIGFSITVATMITLIYLLYKDKNIESVKKAIISFVSLSGICLAIYLFICYTKNINPLVRMLEFLKLSMSNINWGYASLGDANKFAYTFTYYMMPLIIIFTLIYIIIKNKNKIKKNNIILIILGIFYISNIQRGMVRHSLAENGIGAILSLSLIYLVVFMMQNFKRDRNIFLISYICIIIISNLTLTTNIKKINNVFEDTLKKYNSFKLHDEIYNEKQKRVVVSDKMENEYKKLKIVLDKFLDENQTYLDFSNQNLLYALLDKEKPVYVNQSPGLLSGQTTQEMFLYEIINFEKEVPIVLKAKRKILSDELDRILNDYRYYLISEFTYNNYEPLLEVNDYEIWVQKSKYTELLLQAKEIVDDEITIVKKEDYIKENAKKFYLKQIPYIWGNYDKNIDKQEKLEEVGSNIKLGQEENTTINVNIKKIDKSQGNNLKLQIESNKEANITISLYKENQQMGQYNFYVHKGIKNYMLRISTLYAWYEGNIDSIKLNSSEDINIMDISILKDNFK